jgi:hypothetical protein
MKFRCDHPNMGKSGSYKPGHDGESGHVSGGTVTPFGTETPAGYLQAILNISPGDTSYSTAASSMPPNTNKTLTCEVSWDGGDWQLCGQSNGNATTYLTTPLNETCPYPDQTVVVDAWLDIYNTQYWDEADGVTE